MSRTRVIDRVENPVSGYISTNGKTGAVGLRIKGQDGFLPLTLPFHFVVIDADATKIGGRLSLKQNAPRFVSNLCHPGYGVSKYTVITDKSETVLGSGKWRALKEVPALQKAKFTSLIYIISEVETGFEILSISLHGRALSRWIEICKTYPPTGNFLFSIDKMEVMTGGEADLESYVPVFSAKEISKDDEILSAANDADQNLLQPWFAHYFKSLAFAPSVAQVADEVEDFEDVETAPETDGLEQAQAPVKDGKIATLPPTK